MTINDFINNYINHNSLSPITDRLYVSVNNNSGMTPGTALVDSAKVGVEMFGGISEHHIYINIIGGNR